MKKKILKRELSKEKIQSSYKSVARFYNFWSWLTESKAAKQVIRLAEIKGNQKILEIACGTGLVFEKIVQRNAKGQNLGIDLSREMLKKANERLKRLKYVNYELKKGDVLGLEFQITHLTLLSSILWLT